MNRLSRRSIGFLTLGALLLLIIIASFVKFDYIIKGPARFVAYSEWTLVNLEQDKLRSNHFYNGFQNKHEMFLFHFQRPDFIRFSLNDKLQIGTMVKTGDIVAQLMSSEDDMRLASLIGLLNETQASLSALRTGEKVALQREAQEALAYAQTELAAFEPILQRQKELYARNLISEQELDTTQAQYDLYKINVSLQEAHLQTMTTGEKQETISIIAAQVNSIANQLEIFKQKLEAKAIKSPINGILVQPDRTLGELCHICEIDSMVVQMPIKASDVDNVKAGMPIKVYPSSSRKNVVELHVLGVNSNASIINLQPMYMLTAIAPNTDKRILHGMTGQVKVYADKTTLFAMFARAWDKFRFNK